MKQLTITAAVLHYVIICWTAVKTRHNVYASSGLSKTNYTSVSNRCTVRLHRHRRGLQRTSPYAKLRTLRPVRYATYGTPRTLRTVRYATYATLRYVRYARPLEKTLG